MLAMARERSLLDKVTPAARLPAVELSDRFAKHLETSTTHLAGAREMTGGLTADRMTWSDFRATLLVTATDDGALKTALQSRAGALVFDLGDASAADERDASRVSVADAVRRCAGRPGSLAVCVGSPSGDRIHRDLAYLIGEVGEHLDAVCIPAVRSAAELGAVDWLLDRLEKETGQTNQIALDVQFDTTAAVVYAGDLASASPRVRTVVFSQTGLARDVGLARGATDRERAAGAYTDVLDFARMFVAISGRAGGAVALTGAQYESDEAFELLCEMARGVGYQGSWCTTEEQVRIAERVFNRQDRELEAAERILEELESPGGTATAEAKIHPYDASLVRAASRTLGDGTSSSDEGEER